MRSNHNVIIMQVQENSKESSLIYCPKLAQHAIDVFIDQLIGQSQYQPCGLGNKKVNKALGVSRGNIFA